MTKTNDKNDLLKRVERHATKSDGAKASGLINRNTGQSFTLKEDNTINLISSMFSQFKVDEESNTVTTSSFQNNIVAVQTDIMTNDLAINKHKLNSQLYELTNFKRVGENVIGGITMGGYVYVKAWERTLKKYVLIRRPIVTPIFSNVLDAFKLNENLNIGLDVKGDIAEYKRKKDNR